MIDTTYMTTEELSQYDPCTEVCSHCHTKVKGDDIQTFEGVKLCPDCWREYSEGANEQDLQEMAHYYGGWDELRKVIDRLEDNDKEAATERYYSRD